MNLPLIIIPDYSVNKKNCGCGGVIFWETLPADAVRQACLADAVRQARRLEDAKEFLRAKILSFRTQALCKRQETKILA